MLIFAAFITFEVCVGIFWPSMGTMRGRYVPEAGRLLNFIGCLGYYIVRLKKFFFKPDRP